MTKKKQNPIFKTIKEYAENTTIHGIQYIFENGSSVYEKFSWILVVFTGAIIAAYLALQGLEKWQKNLILTTVGTTGYPIEKVEFPAITICAQVRRFYLDIILVFMLSWVFTFIVKFQGMNRDIVDAALFQQFKKYMMEKKAKESKTTQPKTDSCNC